MYLFRKHVVNLEYDKKDMLVDGKYVEAKYNFDCDILADGKLVDQSTNKTVDQIQRELKTRTRTKKSIGWTEYLSIAKDILDKKPDCFLWVIVSRHLTEQMTAENPSQQVYCWAKENYKFYKAKGLSYQKASKEASKAAIDYLRKLSWNKAKISLFSVPTSSNSLSSIYNFIVQTSPD
jgi:hypothetical protein